MCVVHLQSLVSQRAGRGPAIYKQQGRRTTMKAKLVFSLGAMVLAFAALTASAFAHGYNAEKAGEVKGTGHVFKAGEVGVECNESIYKYPASGKTLTLLVTPSYSGCKVNGGIFKGSSATVTVGGTECMYKFNEPQNVSGSPLKGEGTVTIEKQCSITIKVLTCTITIAGEQTHGKVTGKNIKETAGELEGELTAEVTGIVYTHSGLCTGLGSGSDGEYKGKVVEKGVAIE
jgi:hypothetical protein